METSTVSFIESAKCQSLMHRVTIPIGTEEQNVDRALLDPAPVG